jgi:hypothetical protein
MFGTASPFYPITSNGHLDGALVGYICAKCLTQANAARSNFKAMGSGVRVSHHALQRFILRTNYDSTSLRAEMALLRMYAKSNIISFKSGFMVERFLANDCTEVEYRLIGNVVLVVSVAVPKTIITVELLGNKRVGIDYFVPSE